MSITTITYTYGYACILITQQFIAMQAYIENGEHYYVGKWRANEMCGIDHKSKKLLDHPNDTNSLTPFALYDNNEEYSKNDPNKNHEFDFDNDMKNVDLS